MPTEPTIRKSTHDLALLIAGQVYAANLPEDVEKHFLQNKDQVAPAICRGFILQPAVIDPPVITTLKEEQTLDWWLKQTEAFTLKHMGVAINLRERFAIPAELPQKWKSVIPVFDPGSMTNRDMVDKCFKALKLGVYEETDVMKYKGSEAGKVPTLHFINNSAEPDKDTMNMSANQLQGTKKLFLELRGYGLAMAVYHFATGEYLDPQTFTWFPENRLPGGYVAYGYWYSKVKFL